MYFENSRSYLPLNKKIFCCSDIESLNPAEQIFTVHKMFESHENENKDLHEEETFAVYEMYEFLENILQMEEFNKDLRAELSEAYPNADYMNVLNSIKRNLVRNDCGIVIAGRSVICQYLRIY